MGKPGIKIKTPEQVEVMKVGGHILSEVLFALLDYVKPGVSEIELDALAEKMIRERGGEPGFMRVPGYKHTLCVATNDVVVHGIPSTYVLKEGDIIGLDCGVFYEGFHTDMGQTIRVGKKPGEKETEVDKFIQAGERSVMEAIKMAKVGNRVGHLSEVMQRIIETEGGYSVVRTLVGHGVGRELHEEPEIPGYVYAPIEQTPLLKENMTIAVEIIYNKGGRGITYDPDGWTIRTKDGDLAGFFERSLVITPEGPVILTQ